MPQVITEAPHRMKVALHGTVTRQVLSVLDDRGQAHNVPLYSIAHQPVVRVLDELISSVDLAPDEFLKVVFMASKTKLCRPRSKHDRQVKEIHHELLDRLLNTWWAVYDKPWGSYYFVKHFLRPGNVLFQIRLSGEAEDDGLEHVTQYDLTEHDGRLTMYVWDHDRTYAPDPANPRSLRRQLSLQRDADGVVVCPEEEFDAYFTADPQRQTGLAQYAPHMDMVFGRPPQDINPVI